MDGKEGMSRWALLVAAALAPLLVGTPAAAQEVPGDRVAVYEMAWRTQSRGEVIRRAHAVSELMLRREIGYEGRVLERPEDEEDEEDEGRWVIDLADAPELYIQYLPDYDELRVLNVDVISSYEGAEDIGEERALDLVRRYVEELNGQEVISAGDYNLERPQVGYVRVGGGAFEGEEDYRHTTEYRITLRRELNGIEMANAGIRFSVHTSGRLAGIRVGGVSVNAALEDGVMRPLGEGGYLTRQQSDEEIDRRFREDLASTYDQEADIAWSRLMYVMPDDVRRALVEPRRVFSFSLRFPAEGETVVSRRQVVGYSIVDPEAAPIDFTAAAEDQPDQRATRRR